MNEQTELKFDKNDIKETPELMDVIVTKIYIKKASEIYGDKAKQPDKKMLCLVVENDEYKLKREYNIPYYENKNVHDSSKLGRYLQRYSELHVGSKCQLLKDKDGYYELRID